MRRKDTTNQLDVFGGPLIEIPQEQGKRIDSLELTAETLRELDEIDRRQVRVQALRPSRFFR